MSTQRYWKYRAKGHPKGFTCGYEYRGWLFRYVFGHGKNRLPADHPARERGQTLDVIRLLDLIGQHMNLNTHERAQLKAVRRKVDRIRARAEDTA